MNQNGYSVITVLGQNVFHEGGSLDPTTGHIFNLYYDQIMKINELEVGKRMIIADTNWMDRDFTFTRLVISRVSKKLFSLVQTNSTDTCIMKHSIVPIDYKPRFPKPDLPNGDPKSFYLLGYIDKPFDESNTLRAKGFLLC